jgi:hypothetical protein
MRGPAPSPLFGLRRAVELWRVVLGVTFGSVVVFLPLHLVLWTTAGGGFGALPSGDLPNGEILLITVELLRPAWPALVLAGLSSVFALWGWTVLWHAGVIRWVVYSGRRGVRLAEILSRGLFGWWRWARLGFTSVAVVVVVFLILVVIFFELEERAVSLADDSAMGFYLEAGILLGLAAAVLCWLATLRGAWLLGEVNRRSAVLAWCAGLWGTMRQPLKSLWTLTVWALPGLAASVLPLVAGWQVDALRAPLPSAVVGVACGLVTAFCTVALFLSFAPVTGLTDTPPKDVEKAG